MNRNDTIDLLSAVTASDSREIGEADVTIWSEVLGTMQLSDCLAALIEFRRESPGVWLEPGHIVKLVRATVLARHEAEQLTLAEQRQIADMTRREKLLAGLTPAERERAIITSEGEIKVPASPEHRAKCMAEIRAILSRPGTRFGMSPNGARLGLNPDVAGAAF